MREDRFKDKGIIVTGRKGIGKASTIAFAEEGGKVAIAVRRGELYTDK